MKVVWVLFIMLLLNCNTEKDANDVKVKFPPELLPTLSTSSSTQMWQYFYYFGEREVDQTVTPSCGTATPGVTLSGTGTGTGTTTTQQTTGTGTSNTKFTIFSQMTMKKTGELLTLKFAFDTNQFQGTIDPQQGFVLSGGVWRSTITGRQGTVKWGAQGVGYIDESATGSQTVSYMKLDLELFGFYQPPPTDTTTSTNNTVVFECFTNDGKTCTTSTSSAKCYTYDSVSCITTNSGSSITIKATVNCSAKNIVPSS